MRAIDIIIPCRENENAHITLKSLAAQTLQDFNIVVVKDGGKGANWARNKGASISRTEFLLFSDNDIEWEPDAIRNLWEALVPTTAAYSYGSCLFKGEEPHQPTVVRCDLEFDEYRLKQINYISTNSLIKRVAFPGFDEKIKRLQDWDLFLTMLKNGYYGVYCKKKIFETVTKPGITNGEITWEEAEKAIKEKHGI